MKRTLCMILVVTALLISQLNFAESESYSVFVNSKGSLVHVGENSIGATEEGLKAINLLIEAIEKNQSESAKKAAEIFGKIVPSNQFAGEYPALQWFANFIATPEEGRKALIKDNLSEKYVRFYMDNNCATLKDFLNRRYELVEFDDDDPEQARQRLEFIDNLTVFLSPSREKWENANKVLEILQIKEGDRIADVGCGSGYYSTRFSKLVGEKGMIYALDIEEEHINFLHKFSKDEGIRNIFTMKSRIDDYYLPEKVDMVFMSSVYNHVYLVRTEIARKGFVESIKQSLKNGGRLVILDNTPSDDPELLYPGCHTVKELIIAQLELFGFELESTHQISPLRYLLIFRYNQEKTGASPKTAKAAPKTESKGYEIKITSANSLIHIGSLDSFDISEGGILAAKLLLGALEDKQPKQAEEALEIYKKLIPKENFGGEYTALQWFAEYYLAPESVKKTMREDKLVDAYYRYLGDNDYTELKEYLKCKYRLKKYKPEDPQVGQTRRAFMEDFILFNNPKREEWEKTSKTMEMLKIKKGYKIADIGCGPGYYSYIFSKLVGNEGKVYALDIKQEHLDFLDGFIKENGITNIVTILSKTNDCCVTDPVDLAYMCSLYHIIYSLSSEKERGEFVESIKKAIKPGGSLVIVDNGPVSDTDLPYHGPYIDKDLIISQLEQYGFHFEEYQQIIPQRYYLRFRKK